MTNRTTQGLLAERRAAVTEMRRADTTSRAMMQFAIDQIDRELAERKVIAAGVLQPPIPLRDIIAEVFAVTRTNVDQLEAERDARELVGLDRTWSPAQHVRAA